MAYTGIIPGDYARFYIDGEAVGYSTNCSLDFTRATRETLHKDNYTGNTGWATSSLGQASGTFSGDAFFSQDGFSGSHLNPFDIFTLLTNGTQITVQFRIPPAQDAAGDKYWEFEAYITGQSITAATNDDANFSFSGIIIGEPEVITAT